MSEQSRRADVLEKTSEQLKEKQRSRTITDEQRKQFLAAMADAPKGKVQIGAVTPDNEAQLFAKELKAIIEEAHFDVDPIIRGLIVVGGPEFGVRLEVENHLAPPAHANGLLNALNAIVKMDGRARPEVTPADTVFISVFGKP